MDNRALPAKGMAWLCPCWRKLEMEEDVRIGGCGRLQLVMFNHFQFQGFKSLGVILACECCCMVSGHMLLRQITIITTAVTCHTVDTTMTNLAGHDARAY